MTDPETPTDESIDESLFEEETGGGLSETSATGESGEGNPEPPDDAEPKPPDDAEPKPPDDVETDGGRLRAYLDRALLVAFLLLGVLAALQFYFQTGAAIEVWVADPYEPVVKAAFNLAVLFLAAAGLTYELRRVDALPTSSSGGAADD